MQTIIYTNNKRESSNYEADRIVYSDRVEVSQLISSEMDRYNISHIHLWFIQDNVSFIEGMSEAKLLISMGKYLIENKDQNFKFEYVAEKYNRRQLKSKVQKQQDGYRKSQFLEVIMERRSQDQSKSNPKIDFVKQLLIKEEIKFTHFKEFQNFIHKELVNNKDDQIIKKYIFKTNLETIGISFINSDKKSIVQHIVDEDSNQIYNARLNYRKISTLHPEEEYEKRSRKTESCEVPTQLYHKLILYLLINDKSDQSNKKSKNFKIATLKQNHSQQALAPWRIKEEKIDHLTKYEKECELIKQEIENQKILFRNKIKVIENYIGDSINAEKLLQEEEEVQTSNQLGLPNNTNNPPPFKKMSQIGKRASLAVGQIGVIADKMAKFQNNLFLGVITNVSEFKRLKEISETMRNIDNIIYEQNMKIEGLKSSLKEASRNKEEILFSNAKEINAIKNSCLGIKQEIERKKNEMNQKIKNGEFSIFRQYKSKEPSATAKETLEQHINFVKEYHKKVGVERILNCIPQNQQSNQLEQRQTNRSYYKNTCQNERIKSSQSSHLRFRQKRLKDAHETLLKKESKQNKFDKLQPKNAMHHDNNVSASNLSSKSIIKQQSITQTDQKLAELIKLYNFFILNNKIISQIGKEVCNFHRPQTNSSPNSTINHLKPGSKKAQLNYLSNIPILEQAKFPIIQAYLASSNQSNSTEQIVQKNFSSHRKQSYIVESGLPRDCFDLMINDPNRKDYKLLPYSHHSIKEGTQQSELKPYESFKNKPQAASTVQPKISKFKRITIEEAISLSSNLKKILPQM